MWALCSGMGCCHSPSRCHWLRTVRQKSSWRHLFPREEKKGKKNAPHQCETRRRRQTSAQSRGSHWLAVGTKSHSNHLTHNTPTNPKAFMQPPPTFCRRRIHSKPDAVAHLTFSSTLVPLVPLHTAAPPAFAWFGAFLFSRTLLICAELYYHYYYYFSWWKPRQRTFQSSTPG